MGRRPWATPEQTAFLESKLPLLDEEKENHGLTPFYARIAVQFIEHWASPIVPIPEERRAENLDPQAYANERRGAVSQYICVFFELALIVNASANRRMVQETPKTLCLLSPAEVASRSNRKGCSKTSPFAALPGIFHPIPPTRRFTAARGGQGTMARSQKTRNYRQAILVHDQPNRF